jgi:hypothetical protein
VLGADDHSCWDLLVVFDDVFRVISDQPTREGVGGKETNPH